MTKVVVDESLRAKLHNLEEMIELCDSTGRTVALVHPVHARSSDGTEHEPIFTDEEVEQSRRQTGGKTLGEVWKTLGQG